jgi:phosphatidylserine/phosphatidylglycerophosphate/cardiolipin synthase-like enzyme
VANKLTNPLRNVPNATTTYEEIEAYGPSLTRDLPGPPAGNGFNSYIKWKIKDPTYAQAVAIWDGRLYIVKDETPSAPDSDKRVTLALLLSLDYTSIFSMHTQITELPNTIVPLCCFYTNIKYSTLGSRLKQSVPSYDKLDEQIAKFLDLSLVGGGTTTTFYAARAIHVKAGMIIGDIGETEVNGNRFHSLSFEMSVSLTGKDSVYPAAFYKIALQRGFGLNGDEWNQNSSIWAVTSKRVLISVHDEWNERLGPNSSGNIVVSRISVDGSITDQITEPVNSTSESEKSEFAFGGTWLERGVTKIRTEVNVPNTEPPRKMLLSKVPSNTKSVSQIEFELEAPAEIVLQALDAEAWFPAQGGKIVKMVNGSWNTVDVTIPVPHKPERYTNGNKIIPLIDGKDYYKDLNEELEKISSSSASGHFLCHAGWWFDHEVPLIQDHDYSVPKHTYKSGTRMVDHWKRIGNNTPIFGLFLSFIGGPHKGLIDAFPNHEIVRILNSSTTNWRQDYVQWVSRLVLNNFGKLIGIPFVPNDEATESLNEISKGQAIWDARYRPAASHHQKLCVLKNSEGLVAYVGGIDINPNRVNSLDHDDFDRGQTPYHDIQAKVEGPASLDILRSFISRWNDHPALPSPDEGRNGKKNNISCPAIGFSGSNQDILFSINQAVDLRSGGTNLAQIARTYGNCSGLNVTEIQNGGSFATASGYSFAPDGDFTIESAVLLAIHRARKFIYIEDQYLASLKVAVAVAERIKAMKNENREFFVYIVMPYFERETSIQPHTPGPPDRILVSSTWSYTMSRWYDILNSADPFSDNCHWGLFNLSLPKYSFEAPRWQGGGPQAPPRKIPFTEPDRRIYVHAKAMIIDDIWATIGSANVGVRSYTNDSEMNVNFIDGKVDHSGRRISIRDFRAVLWSEHLQVFRPETFRDFDGNSKWIIDMWRSIGTSNSAPRLSDPRSSGGSGTKPIGNRVYRWDHSKLYTPRNIIPKVKFRKKNGVDPDPVPPFNITEFSIPFGLTEEFGKQPWKSLTAENDIKPPAINSPFFKFDGEDGAAYTSFDLQQ